MFQTVWCYATVIAGTLTALLVLFLFRTTFRVSRMAVGLAVAAGLIALAGTLLFAFESRAAIGRSQARATYEILRSATRLGSAVAHAESGQRGYLLTRDAQYLNAFTTAHAKEDEESAYLRALLAGDPELRGFGRNLEAKIAEKFIEMDATLAALRTKSFSDSLAIVQTNKGMKLEADIDRIIDDIRGRAQARLSTFLKHDNEDEILIALITGGLLALALVAIITASILSARDQKRRSAAQRELETRNDMLAVAGEIANIGYWSLTADPLKVDWSEQVFRIHGLDPADPLPSVETAIALFVEEDRAKVAGAIDDALASGQGFQFEARLRRPRGEIVDVISRGVCQRDEDGKVISLFGVIMDVTAIRQSERTLQTSERLYRLLAENVTDVLVRYDDRNRLTFVSPSSEKLLGRKPGSLVGTSMTDLVHPEDVAAVDAKLSAWDPASSSAHTGIEYRLKHASGDWVWVEANACHYADDEAGDSSIAMIRDFRRRKSVEDRLAAAMESADVARAQAESANQAKSDFLAAMSHEIRTPLNSIIGFTGLMLDSNGLAGDLRHQAEIVRSSGTALLTVINDILDFSKIEAGKIEIEAVPFSPRALFANVLSIVRGTAISKSLEITTTIDTGLPEALLGDQSRIQQVLLNLLNNAVKFTAQGSVVLSVRLEKDDAHAVRMRLSVVDTGMGIEKSKQDRLFQRFSQADASVSRKFGGSGLGLAICKRLVELMGGEIGVFSDEGKGSTFWFTLTLPRAKLELTKAETQALVADQAGTLLLVEDIEVNQLLARTLLEADGHTVDVVASGEEALLAIKQKAYDLVLMDVQMPGMGGVAATEAIRAMPGFADLPIIAMTANVLPEQISEFRAAGMNDHIGKPINRVELRTKLVRWLEIARSGSKDHDPSFDRRTFDAIADLLGAKKTQDTLEKFLRELETRLLADDLAPDARIGFQRDAHVVTSIAGLLGFKDLAQSCAAIVMASVDEPSFDEGCRDVLRAKDQARNRVTAMMGLAPRLVTAA